MDDRDVIRTLLEWQKKQWLYIDFDSRYRFFGTNEKYHTHRSAEIHSNTVTTISIFSSHNKDGKQGNQHNENQYTHYNTGHFTYCQGHSRRGRWEKMLNRKWNKTKNESRPC